MKIEPVITSEALVNYYHALWHHILDDSCLEAFTATVFNKLFFET
jgi:hypothetical protein